MIHFQLGALHLAPGAPNADALASAAAGAPPPAAPFAAPIGITAAQTGAGAVPAAPVEFECAIGGCRITAARNARGYCQPHDDAFLTRVYDHTRDIGRGLR